MIDKESKWKAECETEGLTWIEKVDKNCSKCSCMVCGHVDEYDQGAIRRGRVKCSKCHETKMREECKVVGLIWLSKVNGQYSKCSCMVCGHIDTYQQANIRLGKVKCTNCQITKYKTAVKPGWEFINHFSDGRLTYVNLRHNCCDDLVKVRVSDYLRGEYDCPHCSHTHFSDPSYFYVIQVGDIVKLGISNRPDQRYTQYGLPEDATVIEHLRIPLESKRDALVVGSYAKQLVNDYKIPTEISKQLFTKGGFNECYSIDSLDHLLTI